MRVQGQNVSTRCWPNSSCYFLWAMLSLDLGWEAILNFDPGSSYYWKNHCKLNLDYTWARKTKAHTTLEMSNDTLVSNLNTIHYLCKCMSQMRYLYKMISKKIHSDWLVKLYNITFAKSNHGIMLNKFWLCRRCCFYPLL